MLRPVDVQLVPLQALVVDGLIAESVRRGAAAAGPSVAGSPTRHGVAGIAGGTTGAGVLQRVLEGEVLVCCCGGGGGRGGDGLLFGQRIGGDG